MKPSDFIDVLENPAAPNLTLSDERAEILRTLVVHLFYADTRVDEREVALLQRLLPETDVDAYIAQARARTLDLERMAALFPDAKDRDDIITLAEHAVWGDDQVDSREWDIVDALVEKLGVERP